MKEQLIQVPKISSDSFQNYRLIKRKMLSSPIATQPSQTNDLCCKLAIASGVVS